MRISRAHRGELLSDARWDFAKRDKFDEFEVSHFPCATDRCLSAGFISFATTEKLTDETRKFLLGDIRRKWSPSCELDLRNDVFERYKLYSERTEEGNVCPKFEELVAPRRCKIGLRALRESAPFGHRAEI